MFEHGVYDSNGKINPFKTMIFDEEATIDKVVTTILSYYHEGYTADEAIEAGLDELGIDESELDDYQVREINRRLSKEA